jgi:arginine-tRNA-protein transferase
MWQLAQARELNLPYVYLGYWIKESPKMAYKVNFQPLEARVKGHWALLAENS